MADYYYETRRHDKWLRRHAKENKVSYFLARCLVVLSVTPFATPTNSNYGRVIEDTAVT